MPHQEIAGSVSVTTVIGAVLRKIALEKWKEKHSLTKLKAYLENQDNVAGEPIKPSILKKYGIKPGEFWKDAEQIGKEAASGGISGHAKLEAVNKAVMLGEDLVLDDVQKIYHNFLLEQGYEVVASEETLQNHSLGLHGTPDVLLSKNGKMFIGDYKFANRIYPEIELQMAGYSLLSPDLENAVGLGFRLINLKKTGWKMEKPLPFFLDEPRVIFLSLLKVYRRYYDL